MRAMGRPAEAERPGPASAHGRVGGGDSITLESSASERHTEKATGVESEGLDQDPGKTWGFPSCSPQRNKGRVK